MGSAVAMAGGTVGRIDYVVAIYWHVRIFVS